MHKMAVCIFSFYIENEILGLPAWFELGPALPFKFYIMGHLQTLAEVLKKAFRDLFLKTFDKSAPVLFLHHLSFSVLMQRKSCFLCS